MVSIQAGRVVHHCACTGMSQSVCPSLVSHGLSSVMAFQYNLSKGFMIINN